MTTERQAAICMSREREDHSESAEQSQEREALRALFEEICDRAQETFLRKGSHEPILLVLTRLGLVAVHADFDDGFAREPVARDIRERIRSTVIDIDDEPVQDEPRAVILAAEAWMVEYDPNEGEQMAELPPRLDPRRKEILQVLLRTKELSFCRTWPIVRRRAKVGLGEPSDLSAEGMESVWDIILTG